MAAINHGGTFYRLDKSSQSGDCGEANVMALHLASKQVMPFAFAVKGIPSGYSLTQVKAQSNCIRACKRAGYQGHSFKSFRHFAAIFLVNAGVPIEIIKDFMGHRNISTTMIYAKVKTDTLKKTGSAFDQSRVSTKCPQEGNGVKLST